MARRTNELQLLHRLAVLLAGGAVVCLANSTESYRDSAHSDRAVRLYASRWGIDRMQVRQTSSGQLIRFSYRVVDAQKAKVLDAKQATPYLIDGTTKVMLQVPVMDKIGQLRQTADPQNGQEYWMVFSNKGGHVKPGDRVDIVIGPFHVEGLAVL
jgi:hypothetical protein